MFRFPQVAQPRPQPRFILGPPVSSALTVMPNITNPNTTAKINKVSKGSTSLPNTAPIVPEPALRRNPYPSKYSSRLSSA